MHDDLLRELSIQIRNTNPGNHKALCPNCSHERTHKRDPCLSVKIDTEGVMYNCHHCGWHGGRKANGNQPHGHAVARTPGNRRRNSESVWRRQLRDAAR